MKFEEKVLKIIAPIVIMLLIVGHIIIGADNLLGNEDYYFLYNRARQLLTCIQEGNSIGFFYKDFNGVGYGSSFFYGYLTIIPFLPLLNISSTVFLNAYIVVAGMLFCCGTLYLVSHFTSKYSEITCLYLLSMFVIEMFCVTGLIVNYLAIGLSFFFIGSLIDFVRDGKRYVYSSLLFFLILHTHLITAFFSFCIAIIVVLFYFDKTRIRQYISFIFITGLFCSYFIITFFYHLDSSISLKANTLLFKDVAAEMKNRVFLNTTFKQNSIFYGSTFVFCDMLTMNVLKVLNTDGYALFGLAFLFVSLYVLLRKYNTLSLKELSCLTVFVVGTFLGINKIWLLFDAYERTLFQFPMRYMFYLLLGFYIIVGKRIQNKTVMLVLILLQVPNLFIPIKSTTLNMPTLVEFYEHQLGNSEYLSTDFNLTFDEFETQRNQVIDEQGTLYDYVLDTNKLYVKYDTDEQHTLSIPKLYYKGYKCEGANKKLTVHKSNTAFLEVNVPENSKGVYCIYYDGVFFDYLRIINYIVVILVSGLLIFADFKNLPIRFKGMT